MRNLLKETVTILREYGLTPKDVRAVGCHGCYLPWSQFVRLADTDYDAGYGAQEVAKDLRIIGDGWWMDRGEYDGSEWWNMHKPIPVPENVVEQPRIVALTVDQSNAAFAHEYGKVGWEDLLDLNPPHSLAVKE